jgi:hypothetical protein
MSKYHDSNCLECGKALCAIGHRRVNGKNHPDWESRKYHKQCYVLVEAEHEQEEREKLNMISIKKTKKEREELIKKREKYVLKMKKKEERDEKKVLEYINKPVIYKDGQIVQIKGLTPFQYLDDPIIYV